MELLLAALVVFAAYFLKGFTGFGPALIMIPFFTLLFDPSTAINAATIYDFLAGAMLIVSVRKQLDWKFVIQVFAALAGGAVIGSFLLGSVSDFWLKKIIGAAILTIAIHIMFQKNGEAGQRQLPDWLRYVAAGGGGVLGGFIGISGPPLIIYMKLRYAKQFFRTQLIGVFFFGAAWRFTLYRLNGIEMHLTLWQLALFFLIMIVAVTIGSRLQTNIDERRFNRIVAVALLIPAVNLLLTA